MTNTLHVGQTISADGCFTLEGYILGQNLLEIARRLGLPQWRVSQGIYIAYALRVPHLTEFELAGVTHDSTDKFTSYKSGKSEYNPHQFQKLYTTNAVVPVDFQAIKKQYQNSFGVNKLVKVICAMPNQPDTIYPAGGMTPQFLMTTKLPCYVAAFVPANGNFRK